MIGKQQELHLYLHEKKGGYAFNKASIKALEEKSTTNGVNIIKGVKLQDLKEEVIVKQLLVLKQTKELLSANKLSLVLVLGLEIFGTC